MTLLLVAASAVLGTLVVVLAIALVRRARNGSAIIGGQSNGTALAELNERIEQLSSDLESAIQRTEEERRRSRFLGELAGSIDLDEVLARTLEAAGGISGADAALVTTTGFDGQPLVATLGLSAEEAERQAIAGPPDGRAARSIGISYRYGSEELSQNGSLIHSGVAVPLLREDEQLGFLTIFTRSGARSFSEDDVGELEQLALRAGPAIENARRFREARQLADLDALTGLHNRRYFHETLAREVSRAQRYDRSLALIVFDLDDFKAINDRIGHLAGDAVLADAAERVRDSVRSADIACRVGGDEFAVILPESTLMDADQLYRRIQQSVSSRPIGQEGRLFLSAGVTDMRPEDDAVSFFQRADDALYRAKEAGKGRMVTAGSNAVNS
ncbi:MAG: eukaryotic-like serine/threonine-protein kinase [Gaiellaceae bacterium]|nr:eukaryotic-like serine/threonine-protein kinase [Gaiellaceae bacterium]MDX6478267.1 eukaryotic-like serine/threonine-protein kinase [Gaiellaceae bacterium]MDX6483034.1 eukaryotic-like serine/threonine-protein kinase [Gaiellaceae bacterium]MDX6510163.1 eukaryotic-like serine/threonine-protein kinase [Gaiellaceae bacterium]MDX6543096.1 eukaryotic-like serine/threonine-protein kinase [Gaiellaceae bacterium]